MIQISLCICVVWSESSLGSFWIAKDAKFLHRDKKDANQTAWMSEGTFYHVATQMYIQYNNYTNIQFNQVLLQEKIFAHQPELKSSKTLRYMQ